MKLTTISGRGLKLSKFEKAIIERLYAERETILTRLRALEEQEIAAYIQPPVTALQIESSNRRAISG